MAWVVINYLTVTLQLILLVIQYFSWLWIHSFFPFSESNLDLQRDGYLLPVSPFQQITDGLGALAGEAQ